MQDLEGPLPLKKNTIVIKKNNNSAFFEIIIKESESNGWTLG